MEKNLEMVNHPSHYQSETGLEVIDVIEAFTFDLRGIEGFDTGNVIKYICRWKEKGGLTDLNKAKWYLEHLIAHVELLEKENEQMKIEPAKEQNTHIGPLFITFDTDFEAKHALGGLLHLVSVYGVANVGDLCEYTDLLEYKPVYEDYGWVSLEGATINQEGTRYVLRLPKAILLTKNNKKEND